MNHQRNRYRFGEGEQPMVPGGPYTPRLSARLRLAYAFIAVIIVLLASFVQGLYATNIAQIAGGYGIMVAESIWLIAVYAGFAASSSLFLIKGRQQFGIDRILIALLLLEAATAALLALLPQLAIALVARSASGLVISTASAIAVYYLMEVLPGAKRAGAIPIILGLLQLGAPLARMVPVDMLVAEHNHGLHLLGVTVPLVMLALILAFPLPPTRTSRVFEARDAVTVTLLMPAIILLAATLALGRIHWWSDTPWLGWMLIVAVPLFAIGLLVEHGRTHPMLSISWMTQGDVLRFAAVVLFQRIALAEQSAGAIGLLQLAGLNNDQFHPLFTVIMLAQAVGIAIVLFTLNERTVPLIAIAAMTMIAAGAWLDSFANALSRPDQMLLSQALVGMGTTMFIGPALIWLVLRMLRTGSQYLVSMIMLFSFVQNMGSLIGSALVQSYQFYQGEAVGQSIAANIPAGDPIATAHVQDAAATFVALAGADAAPALGLSSLGTAVQHVASIMAILDSFRLIALIAAAGAALLLLWHLRAVWRRTAKDIPHE